MKGDRVAIYARVSHVGDQDPENQIAPLRAYALERGWQIVGVYTDRAPAGHPTMRTAWAQLRQQALKRRFDIVLVWKLDRAFRSSLEAEVALRRFDRQGIAFVCATQPIDTSSKIGRLVFSLLAALAQMERESISERTIAGLARARAAGRVPGRPVGKRDRRKRHRRTKAEVLAERMLAGGSAIDLEEIA
jgi:DNA invertase Pin-like site-specific DNA recombinase